MSEPGSWKLDWEIRMGLSPPTLWKHIFNLSFRLYNCAIVLLHLTKPWKLIDKVRLISWDTKPFENFFQKDDTHNLVHLLPMKLSTKCVSESQNMKIVIPWIWCCKHIKMHARPALSRSNLHHSKGNHVNSVSQTM